MTIFEKVKALSLPIGQYVVFGGGPLDAHGIRNTNDVDILVTADLYETLRNQGWEEKKWSDRGSYLAKGDVQVDDSWHYGSYDPSPEEIIVQAEIIQEVPFAPLNEVIKWKRAFARPKDLADIKLIEDFLRAR